MSSCAVLSLFTVAAENGDPSDHYMIIQTSHYAHCLILLQCVNTELQPVITELMVG